MMPPVEATASTAAAKAEVYPIFFIIGIVNTPVVAELPEGDPEIEPNIADATTAAFAGPPVDHPVMALSLIHI